MTVYRGGLPARWGLCPADLPARLEAQGFVDTGDEPAMAADVRATRSSVRSPTSS